jgi:hypothetical protein
MVSIVVCAFAGDVLTSRLIPLSRISRELTFTVSLGMYSLLQRVEEPGRIHLIDTIKRTAFAPPGEQIRAGKPDGQYWIV